jgi:hypothetical protein
MSYQMVLVAVILKGLKTLRIGTFIQFCFHVEGRIEKEPLVMYFIDIRKLERVTPFCTHDVLFYSDV